MFEIFCDSLQEGMWFRNLHPSFSDANIEIIPNNKRQQQQYGIDKVLIYDRPDIILKDNNRIIFVLERTVEVPSGHNVGQRFGRLVAAAKERIPVVYFGPYAAYKHGGITSGPRYMNLRLFYSLKNVSDYYNTAITTINWPVDFQYEVLKTPQKDKRIKEYMDLFLSYYSINGFNGLTEFIKSSDFQKQQYIEQESFAENEIRNPEQYDVPPDSVEIMSAFAFENNYTKLPHIGKNINSVVVYNVGMTYIRSDPYCGMAALYYYLYCNSSTALILYFPNIHSSEWYNLRSSTKTYRMFKEFSDAILFQDRIIPQHKL
ncbi:MAG: hypothetical protein MR224_04665 [Dorea sp.]|nr:hypothetical protein [Dorea sp.]